MSRSSIRSASAKDVARMAGVSLQTVSRVVNATGTVAEATRARVQQAIDQLGYQRNQFALYLQQGRSRVLGLVVPSSTNPFSNMLVHTGLALEAEALGYSLLIKHLPKDHVSDEAISRQLLDQTLDGILWMHSKALNPHEHMLPKIVKDSGVPIVVIGKSQSIGVPFSAFDNYAAGLMATRHLIERGRQRIVHIAGPADSWDAQERLRGWRTALQEAGLPASDDQVCFAKDWHSGSGRMLLPQLLEVNPGADAVFAANDNLALGAMLAAHRLGSRIPDDLAFVGVDNAKNAECFYPPLTTLQQDHVNVGRQAVKMLSRQVEAKFSGLPLPAMADHLELPVLIARESS